MLIIINILLIVQLNISIVAIEQVYNKAMCLLTKKSLGDRRGPSLSINNCNIMISVSISIVSTSTSTSTSIIYNIMYNYSEAIYVYMHTYTYIYIYIYIAAGDRRGSFLSTNT